MLKIQIPKDWPPGAPPYFSKAGWEYEKYLAYQKLKQQLSIKKHKL